MKKPLVHNQTHPATNEKQQTKPLPNLGPGSCIVKQDNVGL